MDARRPPSIVPRMHWLLLRGLAREQRHWGEFPSVLRARLDGDGVHCLDLPGTGTEHARQSPASIAAIAEDLRRRWLDLRATRPGPWGLVAASLGGMVAMSWCAAWPEDFSRLVLLNTSAGDLSPPWQRLDVRLLPKVLRTLFSADEQRRQRSILEMTTQLQPDLAALSRRWARVQGDAPVARTTVLRQLFAGMRFRVPARLGAEVLVLGSDGDRFVSPACPRKVASHLGARLEVHPTAGHDLPLDAPEWVAERIAAWARPARTSTRGHEAAAS